MHRVLVSSSDIRSVGYDSDSKVLEIEFHSGGVYQYYAVPQAVYGQLMSAASHGRYFHSHIKGAFAYERVA